MPMIIWLNPRLDVFTQKDNSQDINFNLKSCKEQAQVILTSELLFDTNFVPPNKGGKFALLPLAVYNKKATSN